MIDLQLMLVELDREEATSLRVYDDATGRPIVPGSVVIGHPTIGVGRCLDTHGISAAEAAALAESDVRGYLVELDRLAWFRALDPTRQRAIVNMRHQLGLRGLLSFAHMIAAIEAGDFEAAATAGLASHWAQQTPARARRVMDQLRVGSNA